MQKSSYTTFLFSTPINLCYNNIELIYNGGKMEHTKLKIPTHVAIIMDGNGRWALEKGLSRSKGHEAGFEALKRISEYIFSKGIKVLSIFAFSTENFKRSKEEVNFLMYLFENKFKEYSDYLKEKNIRIIFSGKREKPLSQASIDIMNTVEEETKEKTGGVLNLCMNYSGRQEIVEATKKISTLVQENKLRIEDIDEELFNHYLFQELPPVDFLIRTSGELRISNFMLYQLSYAEMYFPRIYFPDFNSEAFDEAILVYNKRDCRFGGIKNENKSY